MLDILNRFSMDSVKGGATVFAAVALIWLTVVFCTLISINRQSFTKRQRIFWIVIVTAIPLVGVLCYLPFSFRIESYPTLTLLKRGRQN